MKLGEKFNFKKQIYWLIELVLFSFYSFVFKLSRSIDAQIVRLDKDLRQQVKGVAVSTGYVFSHIRDSVEASKKRLHKFNDLDKIDKKHFPKIKTSKGRVKKIAHVVNFFIPPKKNECLYHRTKLALESLENAASNCSNVELIGCSAKNESRTGWIMQKIERNAASELGHKKDFLFLLDMLDRAAEEVGDEDYIIYSNFDCIVTDHFYNNLLSCNSDIVEYVRRDCAKVNTLSEVLAGESWPYVTGRDAFAFKKKTYLSIRKYIPDFIIGEPHWDTALSGICQNLHETTENLNDLYHIEHDQTWDPHSLSLGGEYNQSLWMEARAYGLSNVNLLSVQKKKALVLYNDTNTKLSIKKIEKFISKHLDYEMIFIDLLKHKKQLKDDIFELRYYPILHKGQSTLKLNQRASIKNIGTRILEGFEEIKFISLKEVNRYNYKGEVLLSPYDKEYNFFIENEKKFPNIRKQSYLNDEGLLELCWV